MANALAAASATFALGVPPEQIAKGLLRATPPKGRLMRLSMDGYHIIDDTYNANPTSMLAAAKVLEAELDTKILVLGDIFELGDAADDEHTKLGHQLALRLRLIMYLLLGNHMAHTAAAINEQNPLPDIIQISQVF